jgi:hypothetical protein
MGQESSPKELSPEVAGQPSITRKKSSTKR